LGQALARKIAELAHGDEKLMEQAFTAGMMHDVGKLILAENISEIYLPLTAEAQKQKRPLVEAERESFHATHAEAGACLLDLWGLPTPLVEAVGLHHEPTKTNALVFSPLTAVHVANVLEHETGVQDSNIVLNELDLGYLGGIGLADRVDFWRAELRATD
jgi:HD-like signal output (HDOD) protein